MDGAGAASPNRIQLSERMPAIRREMRNRSEYVGLWFQRALADAKAARSLAVSDAVLALYLIQQSAEKACKALLLEWGDSFDAVFRIGHKPLKVFLKFAKMVMEKADMTPAITQIIGENSYDALDRFVNDQEQWANLAVMLPEAVSALLSVRNVLNDQHAMKLKHFPRYRKLVFVATPIGSAGMVAHEIAKKLPNFHHKDTMEFARFFINIRWNDFSDATGRLVTVPITKRQMDWYLKRVNAYVGLFVLSAITFPHEAYARYPARPDSPPDGLEAIRGKRKGKFGIQHYDNRIGAFALIQEVITEAEAVLKDLTVKMPSST